MKKLLVSALVLASFSATALVSPSPSEEYPMFSLDKKAEIMMVCGSTGGINMGIINSMKTTVDHNSSPYHMDKTTISYSNDNTYGQPDVVIPAQWSQYNNAYVIQHISPEVIQKMAATGLVIKLKFGYDNVQEVRFDNLFGDVYSMMTEYCK
jgi:hypothetical protein